MSLTRHAIRVHAALDGLKDGSDDDVIDSLLPFLAPILEVMRGTAFAPQLIVLGARKLYGWNISTAVAEVFRDRLIAKGYLRREMVNRMTIFICEPPPEPALSAAEIATTTALNEVIDALETFPDKLSSLFHVEKSRDELREMLVKFLVGLDAFGQNEMLGELRNIANGSNEEHKLATLAEGGRPLSAEDKYLCARFVSSLYREKSPLLQHLSQIASVGLLAEVVKDFAKPTGVVKRSDLTIVLDAPLALDLVGTSGTAAASEAREITDALKSIGCNFVLLGRSCAEITRVLSSLLSTPKPDRHGFTHSAMMKGEVSEDYVKLVRDDPEEVVRKHGVAIRNISLAGC